MAEINLKPFCAESGGRYAIDAPWVSKGWRYATDGRMLVRVPTDAPDDEVQAGPKRPPAADLFNGIDFAKCDQPWIYSGSAMEECAKCCGRGFCEPTHTCFHCGEITGEQCSACDGDGMIDNGVPVGEHRISSHAQLAIITLEHVRFAQSIPRKPIPFIADGDVQGLVMPLPVPETAEARR